MKTFRTAFLTYFVWLFLSLLTLLLVPRSYGARPRIPLPGGSLKSCPALVEELQAMKQAQTQIILSLAQNHDIFADQLSDLSFELALYNKSVPPKAIQSMEKSAQAYRLRSLKAQESGQRLEDLTGDLIQRVQTCLNKNL
jgi:hypothetical protein